VPRRGDGRGIPHVGAMFWLYIVLIVVGLVVFSAFGIAHR
jgi:hypothetical protein